MVNTKSFIATLACASLGVVQAGLCRLSTSQSTDAAATSTTESVSSTVISSVDSTTDLTSTTELTTTTTTVETTSSASTTEESTTTTSPTACPTPVTCNNLGFDWAYYSNPAQNTDSTYSNFNPHTFKRVNPLYVGTSPYIGGLFQPGSGNPTGPIYGSTSNLNLDYFALNHHAFLYACETGTYKFDISYANDGVDLWLGAKAYMGWDRTNTDIKARYDQPNHIAGSGSFSVDIPAGTYVPLRFFYGQAQYGGGFYFTITAPSGQVLLSNDATASPYVVRYSCDGITAPRYPAFGSEI